jgi:hypothetical protein
VHATRGALVNTMHRKLIEHELGHAVVGLLAGLRVKRVWAPPPGDMTAPPANPDAPAGYVDFEPGGDQRARALALLGGPLAEGKPAPSWPIAPRTDDERKLAKLVGDSDELTFMELVRDAEETVAGGEFTRMHSLACELVAHPPHTLDGKRLDHIREATMPERKYSTFATKITTVGDEHDDSSEELDEQFDERTVRECKAIDLAFAKAERVHRKAHEIAIKTFEA